MSIFSRLADIINSNLTALLDKAEDPQKMVRLIIQEMEDELVKERSNLARFLANQKEIGRQVSRHQERVAEWQGKAELALTKGREDLARAALIEKSKQAELADALTPLILILNETEAGVAQRLSRKGHYIYVCLLYTSPSPRDRTRSRMPSSA